MRYLSSFVLVLLVWVMLAFLFASDLDRFNRAVIVAVGIVVTALAVLVSRRPSLPKPQRSDIGAADGSFSNFDSHNSNHDGDGGHGGSDGGDGGH